jgi:hypothetical protein
MKSVIIFSVTVLLNFMCFAQRGVTKRSFEVIGLPKGEEVFESLIIAVPLILIGVLIMYLFSWRKKSDSKESNKSENIGCFGGIILAVGAFFLLPLFAWVEYFFVNILAIGFAIFIIVVIIYLIYSALKKK